MRFGSRGPSEFFSQIRHGNAWTETAWEDGVQGLDMAMSTVDSDISACCFTDISRA